MEQKYVFGIAALTMVALLGVGMVSASEFRNGISRENRDTLKNTMEFGNYEAWKEIKMSQISEERFEEMKLRHQERAEFREALQEARESGYYSKVQELKTEFEQGKGMHKRNMHFGECTFAK